MGAKKRTMPALRMKGRSTSASGAEARASPAVKTTWSSLLELWAVVLSRRAARFISRVDSSARSHA